MNGDTLLARLRLEQEAWTGRDSDPSMRELLRDAADEIERLREYEWMYRDLCK